MKLKVAILGSTGSIGQTLLKLILKDKRSFQLELLSANKDYKKILKQAILFNAKNIILVDKNAYEKAKLEIIRRKISINIFNNFDELKKIFPKKIDYVMSSIVGMEGLEPTIKIIKHCKQIAIANKESIICAWNLIKKELDKYKTNFLPVDSEHFSIWYALKNLASVNVNKIYLTASGGSLLNIPKKKIKYVKLSKILKHPNWKMGKKITVDSATLMNKVFEVIEAKKIFNLNYSKIDVLIHPKSYIHAILKFNDAMIKIIAHDTTMEIPIYNTLYSSKRYYKNNDNINLKKLNQMRLKKVDIHKFPYVKILKMLPENNSLFETVLVSINDNLVKFLLEKKINYHQMIKLLFKIIKMKKFQKFKKKTPKSISEVVKVNDFVKLQINNLYKQ